MPVILFVICLVAQWLLPDQALAQDNWGRGPFELQDQFPLALLHQSPAPRSPAVGEVDSLTLGAGLAWTNTHNRVRRTFNVDAEQRTLGLALSYVPVENLEIAADLPVVWRGGGVLDSFIYDWHNFWGLPQGPRDGRDVDNNDYTIQGRNDDGSTFDLDQGGVHLSNLQLRGKYLLARGDAYTPAVALHLAISLPSGADTYGHDGTDLTAGVLVSKELQPFYLYGGGYYSYYSDPDTAGIQFERHRGASFLSAEYPFFERFSLLTSVIGQTSLSDSIERFPEYELYLDLGVKWEVSPGTILEFLVRENPAPDKGTADFTFVIGGSRVF